MTSSANAPWYTRLRDAVLHNGHGERSPADFNVEFPLRDGKRKFGTAFEESGNLIHQTLVESINGNSSKPANTGCREFRQQLSGIPMRIDRRASGELQAAVQPLSIGHADFDPCGGPSGQVANKHRGIIPGSDALHIVERIRMIDAGKTLSIEYTMSDPKSWEGEWKMTKRWSRVDERDIAEVSCLPDLNQHMPTTQSKDHVR